MRKPLLLTCLMLCASSAAAQAVGFRTQMSCAGDYYAYCSQHPIGSPGVRKCMRAAGPKLSKGCIDALIADGEVSRAQVERERQRYALAKAKPKTSEPNKTEVAAASNKAQPGVKKEVKKTAVTEKTIDTAPKKVAAEVKAASEKSAASVPAQKVAAVAKAAQKPKAAAVAAPRAVAAVPKPVERVRKPQTVSLDEATFEALKNRGAAFVVEEERISVAKQLKVAPARAASETVTTAHGDAWQASTETEADPAYAANDTGETPSGDEPSEFADASEEAAGQPIVYPPGRMSLGRKLSSATEKPQAAASWWDQLVDAVSGH